MRIAIIGSGIAGLSAAWLLNRRHQVTLYERNDYFGGHGDDYRIEYRLRAADGHWVWVLSVGRLVQRRGESTDRRLGQSRRGRDVVGRDGGVVHAGSLEGADVAAQLG